MEIASFGPDRRVTIRGAGGVRWQGIVAGPQRITFEVPAPEMLTVTFAPGPTRVRELLPGSSDDRLLGVTVTGFRVARSAPQPSNGGAGAVSAAGGAGSP